MQTLGCPLSCPISLRFSLLPRSRPSRPAFPFEGVGSMGSVPLGGNTRDMGGELPHLLPWPPLSMVLTASPLMSKDSGPPDLHPWQA